MIANQKIQHILSNKASETARRLPQKMSKEFFDNVLTERKITYPCNDINRFLTYGRILDPCSKWGTYDKVDTYYGIENNFDYHHILRHLDVLCDNFDSYMEHLFDNSKNIVKRNTSVCYFDCTNYYFECEHEDDILNVRNMKMQSKSLKSVRIDIRLKIVSVS